MPKTFELRINGRTYSVEAEAETSLLEVLRDRLDLTGAKYGCGEAQCGACTVLIGDTARRSCVTPAASVVGKEVTTIEGLARGDRLHPVQQAFLEAGAFQCGYCTPGMILSVVALLRAHANPAEKQIAQFLEGNICRCGTYPRILAAVKRAVEIAKKPTS